MVTHSQSLTPHAKLHFTFSTLLTPSTHRLCLFRYTDTDYSTRYLCSDYMVAVHGALLNGGVSIYCEFSDFCRRNN